MTGRWQVAGVTVFVIASLLLLTMGGAIVVAPITVPLMFLACRRHPTTAFRIAGTVLTALTVAEVAWALTYLQVQEAKPWIWLLPIAGGLLAAGVFAASTPSGRRSDDMAGEEPPGTFAGS